VAHGTLCVGAHGEGGADRDTRPGPRPRSAKELLAIEEWTGPSPFPLAHLEPSMARLNVQEVISRQRREKSRLAARYAARIYAASLRASGASSVDAQHKQEPSGLGGPKGSTAPCQVMADRRAARAQSDTQGH
jgi:hypothetical protein